MGVRVGERGGSVGEGGCRICSVSPLTRQWAESIGCKQGIRCRMPAALGGRER